MKINSVGLRTNYFTPNCGIHETKYGNLVRREGSESSTEIHVISVKETPNGSGIQEGTSKRRNKRIRYNNLSQEGKNTNVLNKT